MDKDWYKTNSPIGPGFVCENDDEEATLCWCAIDHGVHRECSRRCDCAHYPGVSFQVAQRWDGSWHQPFWKTRLKRGKHGQEEG